MRREPVDRCPCVPLIDTSYAAACLAVMATALYYRSFYDSAIFPKWQLGCPDPLEAVLAVSDRYRSSFLSGAASTSAVFSARRSSPTSPTFRFSATRRTGPARRHRQSRSRRGPVSSEHAGRPGRSDSCFFHPNQDSYINLQTAEVRLVLHDHLTREDAKERRPGSQFSR